MWLIQVVNFLKRMTLTWQANRADHFLFRPACHTVSRHSLLFMGRSEVTGSTGSQWVDKVVEFPSLDRIARCSTDKKKKKKKKDLWFWAHPSIYTAKPFKCVWKEMLFFFALCVLWIRQLYSSAIALILFQAFMFFSAPVCGLRSPWWGALNRLPQVPGAGEVKEGEVAWMGAGPQEASCFHRDKGLSGCILGRNLSHTSWFCSRWGKRKWQTNLRPERLIDSFWWDRMCVWHWWAWR